MDPSNANIYTREQAEALGLDFDELISMDDDDAKAEMKRRLDELAAALTPGDAKSLGYEPTPEDPFPTQIPQEDTDGL